MHKILIFLLLFCSVLDAQMLTRTRVMMGTFVTVSLQESRYFNDVFKVLNDVDNSLSSYKKDALVYRLNHKRRVFLDANLYEALVLSREFYKRSDAYFDIAIGSITKDLYHFGEDERVAKSSELKESNISINGVHFNHKIAYLDDNIKLDFGGMGKGFAVDKASIFLKKMGVKKGIIAVSGDIRCLDICKININNPFSDNSLASFETKKRDMGISTSGNYNRYVKSTKNNHLINPKQKKPEQNFVSITLIGDIPSSYLDAYATSASVMSKKKAYKFLNSLRVGYIVLEDNKRLVVSSNIKRYVNKLIINY